MWIFSTREFVTLVYVIIIIMTVFLSKKLMPSAINVIKAACTKKLAIPFLIMLLYAVLFVYILTFFSFWSWIYLKDIIIWILFSGIPVCFNAINKAAENHYFRNIVFDNLKFAALVEFFTGTLTFSLLVEFVLQPLLLFFILLQIISDTKKEYKPVRTLMNWIVSIIGFAILALTIRNAIASYKNFNALDLVISFVLPIAPSVYYLPFAHGFAVYAKYEMLFMRMSFKEPENKKVRRKHRKTVFLLCGFSYNKISNFEKEFIKRMYVTMKDSDFESIITDFRRAY